MKLSIEDGILSVDNVRVCYAKAGNGSDSIQLGQYPVTTQYSATHKQELPLAVGLGWIGPANGDDASACHIVLGSVLKTSVASGLLPCAGNVRRVLSLLEAAEDRGALVELSVR